MTIFLGLAVRTPQLAPVPHVHLCPMCYEVKACSAKCSEEPDQTDMHGQPAGSVVDCDDCRAEPTPGTGRVELDLLRQVIPLEYIDGRWVVGVDMEPEALVTYAEEPSPETGHVGWLWWAQGKMGEAKTAKEAMRAAERALAAAKAEPAADGEGDHGA